ncbi:MAG: hypothetical protein QXF25_02400 [Candidatus Pacearchaeota archaeon]
MLMLEWAGFGFGELLTQLSQIGFFSYVLPFLLIFAFSYALLGMIPIFEKNKGAAAIIAIALGFLSLQLNFVPVFFATIFPKFGIGLSVLLVALILSGIFITKEGEGKTVYTWVFFGLGMLIFVVIAISSLSDYTMSLEGFWYRYGALIIVGALIIGAIVAVFVSASKGSSGKP